MVTDDNIRGFLYEIEQCIDVDWKNSFLEWSNIADECNKTFSKIDVILRYREDEKKKKLKIIPPGELLEEIEKKLQSIGNDYFGDPFYYPGDFINNHNKVRYYDNDLAAENLIEIFKVNEKPLTLPSDPLTLRCYSLALKKAFYALAQGDVLPYKVVSYLYSVLFDIYRESERRWDDTLKQEKQREQSSMNASSVHIKINKIKLSDQYSKLKQLLSKFEGIQEEKAAIDRILVKILKTKNEKTLRKYRQYFLDNFDHEKQDIS